MRFFRKIASARRRYFELEAELRRMQESLDWNSGKTERNQDQAGQNRSAGRRSSRARIKTEMNIENPEQLLETRQCLESTDDRRSR